VSQAYASDPDPAPDRDFLPGELGHLVVGNPGRLLDARRTPVTLMRVDPDRGAFEVEIGAFEDARACWELPLEDVGRLQFARDETVARIERARREVGVELPARVDLPARMEARAGDPELFALLDEVMIARGVADLEQRFATTFVSNPRSGEFVKAHAIVLAELGLCPYRGKVVRDPGVFEGPCSRARRAAHLVARLAFTRELWSSVGVESVTLYRGAAVDGPLPEPVPSSFVSATFSREVATAHFEGGPATRTAVLWRQRVPVGRLFMTFLETREMNRRFSEAEAVLIGDPANRAF